MCVPCPLPPPQPPGRIWLLADLPTPTRVDKRDPRAPRPELGASSGPLGQHALLEAETRLRASPARGLEAGPPPRPEGGSHSSAPTLFPAEQNSQ